MKGSLRDQSLQQQQKESLRHYVQTNTIELQLNGLQISWFWYTKQYSEFRIKTGMTNIQFDIQKHGIKMRQTGNSNNQSDLRKAYHMIMERVDNLEMRIIASQHNSKVYRELLISTEYKEINEKYNMEILILTNNKLQDIAKILEEKYDQQTCKEWCFDNLPKHNKNFIYLICDKDIYQECKKVIQQAIERIDEFLGQEITPYQAEKVCLREKVHGDLLYNNMENQLKISIFQYLILHLSQNLKDIPQNGDCKLDYDGNREIMKIMTRNDNVLSDVVDRIRQALQLFQIVLVRDKEPEDYIQQVEVPFQEISGLTQGKSFLIDYQSLNQYGSEISNMHQNDCLLDFCQNGNLQYNIYLFSRQQDLQKCLDIVKPVQYLMDEIQKNMPLDLDTSFIQKKQQQQQYDNNRQQVQGLRQRNNNNFNNQNNITRNNTGLRDRNNYNQNNYSSDNGKNFHANVKYYSDSDGYSSSDQNPKFNQLKNNKNNQQGGGGGRRLRDQQYMDNNTIQEDQEYTFQMNDYLINSQRMQDKKLQQNIQYQEKLGRKYQEYDEEEEEKQEEEVKEEFSQRNGSNKSGNYHQNLLEQQQVLQQKKPPSDVFEESVMDMIQQQLQQNSNQENINKQKKEPSVFFEENSVNISYKNISDSFIDRKYLNNSKSLQNKNQNQYSSNGNILDQLNNNNLQDQQVQNQQQLKQQQQFSNSNNQQNNEVQNKISTNNNSYSINNPSQPQPQLQLQQQQSNHNSYSINNNNNYINQQQHQSYNNNGSQKSLKTNSSENISKYNQLVSQQEQELEQEKEMVKLQANSDNQQQQQQQFKKQRQLNNSQQEFEFNTPQGPPDDEGISNNSQNGLYSSNNILNQPIIRSQTSQGTDTGNSSVQEYKNSQTEIRKKCEYRKIKQNNREDIENLIKEFIQKKGLYLLFELKLQENKLKCYFTWYIKEEKEKYHKQLKELIDEFVYSEYSQYQKYELSQYLYQVYTVSKSGTIFVDNLKIKYNISFKQLSGKYYLLVSGVDEQEGQKILDQLEKADFFKNQKIFNLRLGAIKPEFQDKSHVDIQQEILQKIQEIFQPKIYSVYGNFEISVIGQGEYKAYMELLKEGTRGQKQSEDICETMGQILLKYFEKFMVFDKQSSHNFTTSQSRSKFGEISSIDKHSNFLIEGLNASLSFEKQQSNLLQQQQQNNDNNNNNQLKDVTEEKLNVQESQSISNNNNYTQGNQEQVQSEEEEEEQKQENLQKSRLSQQSISGFQGEFSNLQFSQNNHNSKLSQQLKQEKQDISILLDSQNQNNNQDQSCNQTNNTVILGEGIKNISKTLKKEVVKEQVQVPGQMGKVVLQNFQELQDLVQKVELEIKGDGIQIQGFQDIVEQVQLSFLNLFNDYQIKVKSLKNEQHLLQEVQSEIYDMHYNIKDFQFVNNTEMMENFLFWELFQEYFLQEEQQSMRKLEGMYLNCFVNKGKNLISKKDIEKISKQQVNFDWKFDRQMARAINTSKYLVLEENEEEEEDLVKYLIIFDIYVQEHQYNEYQRLGTASSRNFKPSIILKLEEIQEG